MTRAVAQRGFCYGFRVAVEKLIDELGKDLAGYATDRTFGREVPHAEGSELAAFVHERVERAIKDRSDMIARSGAKLACTRGCTGCCEEPIMVFRPEAARVAQWLEKPENASARAAFVAAYPAWKAQIGESVTKLSEVYATDQLHYVEHHVEAWRKSVLCAFNRDGECTVYPVRPTVCRTGHALETSRNCSGKAEGKALRADFVPLDNFVERTRILMLAAHNAMPGTRGRPEALPHAVFAILAPSGEELSDARPSSRAP
jgi:Fe-S-cluster containining protein